MLSNQLNPQIFNRDVIFIPNLPELILPHLNDLPPITLPYTIHCDPSFHPAPSTINPPPATIYDITLPVIPSPLPLPNPPNTSLHQLASHDNDLALAVQALHHAKGKHAFMTEFERDPVGFLGRWMRSQQRDLEVVVGDGVGMGKGEWGVGDGYGVGPEWRRGGKEGVWGRREVLESVGLMKHEGTGRA